MQDSHLWMRKEQLCGPGCLCQGCANARNIGSCNQNSSSSESDDSSSNDDFVVDSDDNSIDALQTEVISNEFETIELV